MTTWIPAHVFIYDYLCKLCNCVCICMGVCCSMCVRLCICMSCCACQPVSQPSDQPVNMFGSCTVSWSVCLWLNIHVTLRPDWKDNIHWWNVTNNIPLHLLINWLRVVGGVNHWRCYPRNIPYNNTFVLDKDMIELYESCVKNCFVYRRWLEWVLREDTSSSGKNRLFKTSE